MIRTLFVISVGVNTLTWIAYLQRIKRYNRVIDQHLMLAYHMNNTLLEHGIEPTAFAMKTLRDFGIRPYQGD